MKKEKSEIASKLKKDDELVDLLAPNSSWYNKSGSSAKTNSIIPAFKSYGEMSTPFITIQGGTESRSWENMREQNIYVRCYNDIKKSYVKIDEISERIRTVLDKAELSLSPNILVKIRYEFTTQETLDDELNLNFKELRFRLLLL